MSPVSLGAISVDCPLCGERLSCPVGIPDDAEAWARNEARVELTIPEHECQPLLGGEA